MTSMQMLPNSSQNIPSMGVFIRYLRIMMRYSGTLIERSIRTRGNMHIRLKHTM